MNATATMVSARPQRMRALERANQARFARAELKRRVAQGEIEVAEVILTRPWEAERMPVADLLTSQRHWGQTRMRKFLASIAISENKTIGSMTERQRQAVAARLTIAQAASVHPNRTGLSGTPASDRGAPTPSGPFRPRGAGHPFLA